MQKRALESWYPSRPQADVELFTYGLLIASAGVHLASLICSLGKLHPCPDLSGFSFIFADRADVFVVLFPWCYLPWQPTNA